VNIIKKIHLGSISWIIARKHIVFEKISYESPCSCWRKISEAVQRGRLSARLEKEWREKKKKERERLPRRGFARARGLHKQKCSARSRWRGIACNPRARPDRPRRARCFYPFGKLTSRRINLDQAASKRSRGLNRAPRDSIFAVSSRRDSDFLCHAPCSSSSSLTYIRTHTNSLSVSFSLHTHTYIYIYNIYIYIYIYRYLRFRNILRAVRIKTPRFPIASDTY